MDIVGFKESSLNEWEGHVSSVIWTPGCNWRCSYCHATDIITDTNQPNKIDQQQVFNYILDKNGWVDGLCITGGEPTIQKDLCDFIKLAKETLNIQIKLETNGSNPDILEKLINDKLIDCLCLDFKQMPGHKLLNINRQPGNIFEVLQSFNLAFKEKTEVEFHTTLCPNFINIDDIKEMGKFIHGVGLWVLQQYDPEKVLDCDLAGNIVYDKDYVNEMFNLAKTLHKNVILKNLTTSSTQNHQ